MITVDQKLLQNELLSTLYSLPSFLMLQKELINYPTISNIEVQGGGWRMRERWQEGGHMSTAQRISLIQGNLKWNSASSEVNVQLNELSSASISALTYHLELHPLVLLISSLFLSPWPAQVPLHFQASCGYDADPILLGI